MIANQLATGDCGHLLDAVPSVLHGRARRLLGPRSSLHHVIALLTRDAPYSPEVGSLDHKDGIVIQFNLVTPALPLPSIALMANSVDDAGDVIENNPRLIPVTSQNENNSTLTRVEVRPRIGECPGKYGVQAGDKNSSRHVCPQLKKLLMARLSWRGLSARALPIDN